MPERKNPEVLGESSSRSNSDLHHPGSTFFLVRTFYRNQMSVLGQLPGVPNRGQLLNNFQDLKELVEDWSIKEKISFRISDKDSNVTVWVVGQ